jgi:hypothetical protein
MFMRSSTVRAPWRQWCSSRTEAEDDHIENQDNNQREDCCERPSASQQSNNESDGAWRKGPGRQAICKPDSKCHLRNPSVARKCFYPGSKMLEGRAQLLHVIFREIE